MTGRPSSYTPELAAEICRRLAEGESLKSICAEDGMPSRPTFFAWVADRPEFLNMYRAAREMQAHAVAEQAVEDALAAEDAAKGRLAFDARRWFASKLAPRVYGEKLEVEATVKQATLTDEPLNEDDWSKRYGSGGVAASGGSAEGAG